MKYLLSFLLSATVAYAQWTPRMFTGEWKTIMRTCVVERVAYTVYYSYDSSAAAFMPATIPPGAPHYHCTVFVLRGEKRVGKPFSGIVTEEGCFEDKPEDMVARARSLK